MNRLYPGKRLKTTKVEGQAWLDRHHWLVTNIRVSNSPGELGGWGSAERTLSAPETLVR